MTLDYISADLKQSQYYVDQLHCLKYTALVSRMINVALVSKIHSFISLISASDKTHYCYNTKTRTCVIQT